MPFPKQFHTVFVLALHYVRWKARLIYLLPTWSSDLVGRDVLLSKTMDVDALPLPSGLKGAS